jgi:molybdopterin molybdotransferase
MLPEGANSVVMVENTEAFKDNKIAVYKSVAVGTNVMCAGADVKKGTVVINRGEKLTPFTVGLLVGVGVKSVSVYKPVPFFIISTGDELVSHDIIPQAGQIRDTNSIMLEGWAKTNGHIVLGKELVCDDKDLLISAITKGLNCADIILLSGGSSVGERDFTYQAVEAVGGEIFIKGISLKPGKPTIVGAVGDKIIIGLPGHPMAAMAVVELLLGKAIGESRGQKIMPKCYAAAETNFPSSPGRTSFQPVSLAIKDGKIYASPIFSKSGAISPLYLSDGYVLLADNAEGVSKNQNLAVYGFGD